ncbi:hypothetical protein ACJ41O_006945 [Fusarium nematophilum]
MPIPVFACAAFILTSYLIYRHLNSNGPRRRLPPGPKPLPIVGNMRDFPPEGVPEFEHWLKHKDLYGPISSVTVLGTTLVIIHDKTMARDLLEKLAAKTSVRPSMTFANKMCGYESIVLCQGYNATFRRTAAATTLQITYGYTIESDKPDALVDLIERMMTEFSLAAAPFAWLVGLVPLLQHVPEGFPGTTFKQTARKWRDSIQAVAHVPYRFVQQQMTANCFRPSYVSELIQECSTDDNKNSLSPEDEEAIIWTAASLYGAAADLTVITLTTFTLAMILFPDVQRKAQAEIDSIAADRLPDFEDRDQLPYVNAVVKETLRWWPIAPMGFPHAADEDIEYQGHHIPKGAYLLPAVWWFLHDPDLYANPNSFHPERFLSPRDEPDPSASFGYGRRMCPGRFFADSGLYLNIVQTLAVFNIRRAVDEAGNDIKVDVRPNPGILSYSGEFRFKISPRSEKHAELIRRVAARHPPQPSDAGLLPSIGYWAG